MRVRRKITIDAGYREAQKVIEDHVEGVFGRISQEQPDAKAYLALGELAFRARLFEWTHRIFGICVTLDPKCARAHFCLGVACKALALDEESIAALGTAISLDVNMADAHFQLGSVRHGQGRVDEAYGHYQRALAIEPGHAKALYNLALIQLLRGDFENGLPGYEIRWADYHRLQHPSLPQPLWLGNFDISGKRICLHSEQGFGDTVDWVRYVPQVARMGARVMLAVQRQLMPLLSTIEGVSSIHDRDLELPDFDVQCPLGSLHLAMHRAGFDDLAPDMPYLRSDPAKTALWMEKLPSRGTLRVGIAWAGNPNNKNDARRSIPFDRFKALFAIPGCTFINLLFALTEAELDEFPKYPNLLEASDDVRDFSDTAALIDSVDLVIAVDTVIAHVAGALGKPLWLLIPWMPDWRWMQDREDSDLYPSARLFRQRREGDWPEVISRVGSELGKLAARS